MSKNEFALISESSLDAMIGGRGRSSKFILERVPGVVEQQIGEKFLGFATGRELPGEFLALINLECLEHLKGPVDLILARIARVLKAASRPPVHLPRSWAEFHHKNRLAFFATAEDYGDERWLCEIDGPSKSVSFLALSNSKSKVLLQEWTPPIVLDYSEKYSQWTASLKEQATVEGNGPSFSEQVDLKTIGSDAVVQGFSYEYWLTQLKPDQLRIVEADINSSIRVVGPAGSGKTLALCMRAIKLSRDPDIAGERKKILVVTHSWAMAERVDGILQSLNGGRTPDAISVTPLLYVLQAHAGSVGSMATSVLGEDSAEGQRRVLELLERLLTDSALTHGSGMSDYLKKGLASDPGSHTRAELIVDLYEEIVGVLSPQGILPGETDRVADYLVGARDETLPPFTTRADREFCLRVFEKLLEQLVDLGVVTTDQLVLDCIRVFETFSWNMRRETDGYDFILIDELQLFDSQERLAVSLLSRSRPGMVFLSVEDPFQGMFSVVNDRSKALRTKDQIYLEETHRFRAGLFEFIGFLYGKFPLNATPIRVSRSDSKLRKPKFVQLSDRSLLGEWCVQRAREVAKAREKGRRICFVCLSDDEDDICSALTAADDVAVVKLSGFDDVEKLSYQRKAAVVSSWQFVGGTQFSDVVLVGRDLPRPTSAHAKLRELTAIYLGSSRASSSLDIVISGRTPDVLQLAMREKLIFKTVFSSS